MNRFQALMLVFLINIPAAHAYFGIGNFEVPLSTLALSGVNLSDVGDDDNDTIPNWWEKFSWWGGACRLNYTNASDANLDFDGDGETNLQEYQFYLNTTILLNPCLSNDDSDLDGMPDNWEDDYQPYLDKFIDDSKSDPDHDELTNLGEYRNGTNPLVGDTDGDSMPDGWEVGFGLNATNSSDATLDKDGDSETNQQEYADGTDPTKGPFTMAISPSANVSKFVDASVNTSTTLTLVTTEDVTGAVNITKYTNISKNMGLKPLTGEFGLTSGHQPIDKGIEVNASADLLENLTWVYVKIYYTDAELDNSGDGDANDPGDIDPDTLKMWRYCQENNTWQVLNTGTIECGTYIIQVSAAGVDTDGKFVYANVSNLSIFRIAGTLIPEEVKQIITGGGGGGGAPPKTLPPLFTGGVVTLTPQLLIDVILNRKLGEKSFWAVPTSVGASLVLTGEYPSPFNPMVHGVLTKPVKMLLEPLKVFRGTKVESPEAIKDVYRFSIGRVLARYTRSEVVIIAVRDPPVDSMAAVAYAKSIDAPILLTETDDAPEDTINAVKQLNPKRIVIIGGPVAVSNSVESEFEKIAPTERIWGQTRYETASEIAKRLDPSVVVVTDGETPTQDAVIVAAEYRAPILYVSGKEIPTTTRDFLVKHTETTDGEPMTWVTVGIDEDANTEIQGLYSLPEFLTKSRLTIKLYNLGTRFLT